MAKAPPHRHISVRQLEVLAAVEEGDFEAAESVIRLGGDNTVPAYRVQFDGRRLEIRSMAIPHQLLLAELLVDVRWLRIDMRGVEATRRLTFAVEPPPRPVVFVDTQIQSMAVDGAAWVEAELIDWIDIRR